MKTPDMYLGKNYLLIFLESCVEKQEGRGGILFYMHKTHFNNISNSNYDFA